MVDVKGKWALVTGATRGLGYLSAKFMAERGCNLIIHSRTLEASEKVVAEVKSLGVEAYAVAAELSDLSTVEAMLKEIDSKGTQVDIVLNNAGLQIAEADDDRRTEAHVAERLRLERYVHFVLTCHIHFFGGVAEVVKHQHSVLGGLD